MKTDQDLDFGIFRITRIYVANVSDCANRCLCYNCVLGANIHMTFRFYFVGANR